MFWYQLYTVLRPLPESEIAPTQKWKVSNVEGNSYNDKEKNMKVH